MFERHGAFQSWRCLAPAQDDLRLFPGRRPHRRLVFLFMWGRRGGGAFSTRPRMPWAVLPAISSG
eukprot:4187094-Lingulodinium_polyedra.AAC.1